MSKANKNKFISIIIGMLISSSIIISGYLLYGWNVGDVKQYELSYAIGNTFSIWTLLIGAFVAFLHIPFSYVSYAISVFVVPLPMIIAIIYECINAPTSHNLWPFELGVLFIGSAIIHLPSIKIKAIYHNYST